MALNNLRSTNIYPGQRLRVSGYAYTGTNRTDEPSRNGPDYQNGYGDYNSDYRRNGRDAYNGGPGQDYPKSRQKNRRGYSYDDYANHRSERRNGYNGRRDDYVSGTNRYEDEGAPRKRRYRERTSRENGRYADTPPNGNGRRDAVRYTIQRGDTLFDIARRNGISHRELADFNGIRLSDTLMPGQLLLIPRGRGYGWNSDRLPSDKRRRRDDRWGAKQPDSSAPQATASTRDERKDRPSKPTATSKRTALALAEARQAARANKDGDPETRSSMATAASVQIVSNGHKETSASVKPVEKAKFSAKECESLLANPAPRSAKKFREPVQGMIITKFGKKKDGTFSDGISFSVPKGTPVKAAENGVVAYAGSELSGFGNLVLIRHADGYVTAYAHNDELTVHKCDVVKRGQVIGRAGATGNAAKPQLHFELRKGSKPVDPQEYFSRS
jgi:murein DD-endopeptidase MepM/ murein hydrolase activator NlpD